MRQRSSGKSQCKCCALSHSQGTAMTERNRSWGKTAQPKTRYSLRADVDDDDDAFEGRERSEESLPVLVHWRDVSQITAPSKECLSMPGLHTKAKHRQLCRKKNEAVESQKATTAEEGFFSKLLHHCNEITVQKGVFNWDTCQKDQKWGVTWNIEWQLGLSLRCCPNKRQPFMKNQVLALFWK